MGRLFHRSPTPRCGTIRRYKVFIRVAWRFLRRFGFYGANPITHARTLPRVVARHDGSVQDTVYDTRATDVLPLRLRMLFGAAPPLPPRLLGGTCCTAWTCGTCRHLRRWLADACRTFVTTAASRRAGGSSKRTVRYLNTDVTPHALPSHLACRLNFLQPDAPPRYLPFYRAIMDFTFHIHHDRRMLLFVQRRGLPLPPPPRLLHTAFTGTPYFTCLFAV